MVQMADKMPSLTDAMGVADTTAKLPLVETDTVPAQLKNCRTPLRVLIARATKPLALSLGTRKSSVHSLADLQLMCAAAHSILKRHGQGDRTFDPEE